MITIYGIKNCDSVKKARGWLEERGLDYQFHDFKTAGVPAEKLEGWLADFGWKQVINRRSKSWRELTPDVRAHMDNRQALDAAIETPTLIKRPIVEQNNRILIGFDPQQFEQLT